MSLKLKQLMFKAWSCSGKRGDPLYAGKSHYVIENKCRKNVSFWVCHYVDDNKRPMVFFLYVVK
jgi:hypothetical protein